MISPWLSSVLTLPLIGKAEQNKSGKTVQGKSLGSFSDMGEAFRFHAYSLTCFSRLR